MRLGRFFLLLGANLFAAILLASQSGHAAQRTFVASNGSDSNTCGLSDPCRGFAKALSLTDPNGEIIVKDSAGYGSFAINKSVSVIAPPGVYAGISVFAASNGITVTGSDVRVILRGLSINGQGGDVGIIFTASGTLRGKCVVSNMASTGLLFNPATTGTLFVKDSIFRNNVGSGASITANASVDRSRFEDNGIHGLEAEGGTVSVGDSIASRNANANFVATGSTKGSVLTVKNSVASHAVFGIVASATVVGTARVCADGNSVSNNSFGIRSIGVGATLTAARNIVTQNNNGMSQQSSGSFFSLEDNAVNDNTTNSSGVITPLSGI